MKKYHQVPSKTQDYPCINPTLLDKNFCDVTKENSGKQYQQLRMQNLTSQPTTSNQGMEFKDFDIKAATVRGNEINESGLEIAPVQQILKKPSEVVEESETLCRKRESICTSVLNGMPKSFPSIFNEERTNANLITRTPTNAIISPLPQTILHSFFDKQQSTQEEKLGDLSDRFDCYSQMDNDLQVGNLNETNNSLDQKVRDEGKQHLHHEFRHLSKKPLNLTGLEETVVERKHRKSVQGMFEYVVMKFMKANQKKLSKIQLKLDKTRSNRTLQKYRNKKASKASHKIYRRDSSKWNKIRVKKLKHTVSNLENNQKTILNCTGELIQKVNCLEGHLKAISSDMLTKSSMNIKQETSKLPINSQLTNNNLKVVKAEPEENAFNWNITGTEECIVKKHQENDSNDNI